MRVAIDSLREDIRRTLVSHGVPDDEAIVGAEMCVDAELRGHRSHGVRLVRNILAEYAAGTDRREPIRTVHETPASAQIDGGFHLSLFVHRLAVDTLARKATESGIGAVSVRRAGVSGAMGYLVERIAAAGLIGIALSSTPLTVVAPGTSVPSMGTNPLAMAIPRRDAAPLVLDMATSSIAFNQVLRQRETGGSLPLGVASDSDGMPTTDPSAAIDAETGRGRLLPFGGHRGYGLALMIELMVSAGVTGRTADRKRGPVVLEPEDFGAVYIAYRPGLLGDEDDMNDAADALVDDLTGGGARIPGENSRLLREEALASGTVEVDPSALELIHAPSS